jgi:hypothetical protein
MLTEESPNENKGNCSVKLFRLKLAGNTKNKRLSVIKVVKRSVGTKKKRKSLKVKVN